MTDPGDLAEFMEFLEFAHGKVLLPIPDRRQDTSFSCGPACLEACASYFGIEVPEATLREWADADPDEGTEADDLAEAARALGLEADVRTGMTVEDVHACLMAGCPVIVGLQAYGAAAEEEAGDSGHYEVAMGYDPETGTVTLQDPARDPEAGRTEMPAAKFEDVWKLADEAGNITERLGIVLQSPAPAGAGPAVSAKIAKLRREGKPADQAAAIAYSMQRRGEL